MWQAASFALSCCVAGCERGGCRQGTTRKPGQGTCRLRPPNGYCHATPTCADMVSMCASCAYMTSCHCTYLSHDTPLAACISHKPDTCCGCRYAGGVQVGLSQCGVGQGVGQGGGQGRLQGEGGGVRVEVRVEVRGCPETEQLRKPHTQRYQEHTLMHLS